MTSRREFLKKTSIIAAGAILAPAISCSSKSDRKVIIIGAGISGLAAGYKLKQAGIPVTILEARNRIGGRIFSYNITDNLVIELGAEWVGKSHERILELCKEFNLQLDDNTFDSDKIFDNEHFKFDNWDFSPDWQSKWDKIIADYANYTEQDKKVLDKMDWWRFLMNHDIPERDLKIREYLDSTDFGESIRFVSAYAALAEYAESSEKNEMDFKIKGGNSMLPNKIAEAIGSENILSGKKVTSVDYSGKDVAVTLSDGSKLEGSHLICTTPTFAVNKIKWNPGFTPERTEALNALQYARIIKSANLFSERFWGRDNFDMVTDTYTHYVYHATKNQDHQQGVLISYAVGDKADILSQMKEQAKIKRISEDLKSMNENIEGKVIKNVSYYWGEDEFSKGAYAMYGKGQWFDIMPALKKNIDDKIFFAGEHVADWQGFMEGAVNTGEEAAEAII